MRERIVARPRMPAALTICFFSDMQSFAAEDEKFPVFTTRNV
jgi:hypothetical protein